MKMRITMITSIMTTTITIIATTIDPITNTILLEITRVRETLDGIRL